MTITNKLTIATPPDGTRYTLPSEAYNRSSILSSLQNLYDSWSYARVDVPVLEHYDDQHPRASQSFKLSDRDSGVLSLRSDFTPAIANLVHVHYPDNDAPLRFQYCGKIWQAINPDVARTREFTQLGLELVGVSNARADAELIHLARESVRLVGLAPRVEIGNPGFVRALFQLAGIEESLQDAFADAIDRKDQRGVLTLLESLSVSTEVARALMGCPDLYGDKQVFTEARKLAPWPETLAEIDRLEAILAEFEDDSELLIDLGMARRHSYYTGMTFRAYTFDFGQPLLGGGRYDGALLPYAAGFAMGLERLLSALPATQQSSTALVLSLDDPNARKLRAAGYAVERALSEDITQARAYARSRGIPYLLSEDGLEPLDNNTPDLALLTELLESSND